jgi:hypothetical protein
VGSGTGILVGAVDRTVTGAGARSAGSLSSWSRRSTRQAAEIAAQARCGAAFFLDGVHGAAICAAR